MGLKEEIMKLLGNPDSGVQDPEFELEVAPGRQVRGFIVSRSFEGLDHLDRQNMIWDYLDTRMPQEKRRRIISLGALTPAEDTKWSVPETRRDGKKKKTSTKTNSGTKTKITKAVPNRSRSKARASGPIEHSTPHSGRS